VSCCLDDFPSVGDRICTRYFRLWRPATECDSARDPPLVNRHQAANKKDREHAAQGNLTQPN